MEQLLKNFTHVLSIKEKNIVACLEMEIFNEEAQRLH